MSKPQIPSGWNLGINPDKLSIRKWILASPEGSTTKWKTRTAAYTFAQNKSLERGRGRLRTLLSMLKRKYKFHYFESASKLSASTYFTLRRENRISKPFIIRLSDHPANGDLDRYDVNITNGEVDKCELRRILRRWWSYKAA